MSKTIKKLNYCPYHFIRAMINKYDIILMPYNYIFNESMRNYLKLRI